MSLAIARDEFIGKYGDVRFIGSDGKWVSAPDEYKTVYYDQKFQWFDDISETVQNYINVPQPLTQAYVADRASTNSTARKFNLLYSILSIPQKDVFEDVFDEISYDQKYQWFDNFTETLQTYIGIPPEELSKAGLLDSTRYKDYCQDPFTGKMMETSKILLELAMFKKAISENTFVEKKQLAQQAQDNNSGVTSLQEALNSLSLQGGQSTTTTNWNNILNKMVDNIEKQLAMPNVYIVIPTIHLKYWFSLLFGKNTVNAVDNTYNAVLVDRFVSIDSFIDVLEHFPPGKFPAHVLIEVPEDIKNKGGFAVIMNTSFFSRQDDATVKLLKGYLNNGVGKSITTYTNSDPIPYIDSLEEFTIPLRYLVLNPNKVLLPPYKYPEDLTCSVSTSKKGYMAIESIKRMLVQGKFFNEDEMSVAGEDLLTKVNKDGVYFGNIKTPVGSGINWGTEIKGSAYFEDGTYFPVLYMDGENLLEWCFVPSINHPGIVQKYSIKPDDRQSQNYGFNGTNADYGSNSEDVLDGGRYPEQNGIVYPEEYGYKLKLFPNDSSGNPWTDRGYEEIIIFYPKLVPTWIFSDGVVRETSEYKTSKGYETGQPYGVDGKSLSKWENAGTRTSSDYQLLEYIYWQLGRVPLGYS